MYTTLGGLVIGDQPLPSDFKVPGGFIALQNLSDRIRVSPADSHSYLYIHNGCLCLSSNSAHHDLTKKPEVVNSSGIFGKNTIREFTQFKDSLLVGNSCGIDGSFTASVCLGHNNANESIIKESQLIGHENKGIFDHSTVIGNNVSAVSILNSTCIAAEQTKSLFNSAAIQTKSLVEAHDSFVYGSFIEKAFNSVILANGHGVANASESQIIGTISNLKSSEDSVLIGIIKVDASKNNQIIGIIDGTVQRSTVVGENHECIIKDSVVIGKNDISSTNSLVVSLQISDLEESTVSDSSIFARTSALYATNSTVIGSSVSSRIEQSYIVGDVKTSNVNNSIVLGKLNRSTIKNKFIVSDDNGIYLWGDMAKMSLSLGNFVDWKSSYGVLALPKNGKVDESVSSTSDSLHCSNDKLYFNNRAVVTEEVSSEFTGELTLSTGIFFVSIGARYAALLLCNEHSITPLQEWLNDGLTYESNRLIGDRGGVLRIL